MSNYNSPETFRAPGVDDPRERPVCPNCEGSGVKTDENGFIYDESCPRCAGAGVIEPEPADPEDVSGLRDES